ncbi:putative membrane protein [Candidatus Nanobsidianus stetteri]|uniref:Putative membrane protein n=1 Tax=Nanobsidianus stetteri TaxID=1294122 RepID=R1FUC9_NANST|nr:putative membrane protein [Candidatus Nanobsidianus stetteri]
MKGQMMTHGSAFMVALIIAVILLVGYSYFEYHNFTGGFSDFITLFQHYYIQVGIIFLIGFIFGYTQGKAY